MPVDTAPRLPETPLPEEELDGELGGHSLQLVTELNAFAAAHRQLQTDVDDLEAALGQNEAVDASEGQLAATATRLESQILQVSDDANAAMIATTDGLAADVAGDLDVVKSEALGAAGAVEVLLHGEVARVSDEAAAALASEAAALAAVGQADKVLLSSEAAGYATNVEAILRAEIDQARADAANALASELAAVYNRFGRRYEVSTDDAAPVVLATLSPTPLSVQRVVAKVQAQRANRLERAAYTLEALCRAVPSSGVLTVAGLPNDGDQVEMDGVTYTFKTVLTPAAYEVLIGGDAAGTIDNLVKAITLTGTDDVEYGAGTAIHPSMTAERASATTMDAAVKTPGVAGDGLSTTDPTDVSGNLSWAAAVTGGGSDMTVNVVADDDDHEDDASWDAAIAANGADVEISVTGAALTLIDWVAEVRVVELI